MDFRQLRYVVAIAHTMHFTRATEELGSPNARLWGFQPINK